MKHRDTLLVHQLHSTSFIEVFFSDVMPLWRKIHNFPMPLKTVLWCDNAMVNVCLDLRKGCGLDYNKYSVKVGKYCGLCHSYNFNRFGEHSYSHFSKKAHWWDLETINPDLPQTLIHWAWINVSFSLRGQSLSLTIKRFHAKSTDLVTDINNSVEKCVRFILECFYSLL